MGFLRSVLLAGFVLSALAILSAGPSLAQAFPEPEGAPLPDYARAIRLPGPRPAFEDRGLFTDNGLPNIMLTGYWPPTNEMVRRFSPDPVQNPQGWIGADWEGRGYNVYAFFPEFPHGLGKGEGDFEVDYQDTSADFWDVTDQLKPVAIITFGRAYPNTDWEIEWRKRNLSESMWYGDYLAPVKPTPSPPDGGVPAGHHRYTSLPEKAIAKAVNQAGIGVNAWVDQGGDAGAFLCEYIGYHAAWYHDLHADPGDPDPMVSGGHIHVGSGVPIDDAVTATEITVRTLITYLDQPLVPYTRTLSEATGGKVPFLLNPGADYAHLNYVMLGSWSGTSPGLPLPGGAILPLKWDAFTGVVLANLNSVFFKDFMGALDGSGQATAWLDTRGPLPGGIAGINLYFAYAVPIMYPAPAWYASNTEWLRIVF